MQVSFCFLDLLIITYADDYSFQNNLIKGRRFIYRANVRQVWMIQVVIGIFDVNFGISFCPFAFNSKERKGSWKRRWTL